MVARRLGDQWQLQVGDVGTGQARSLATAERVARDVLIAAGHDNAAIEVQLHPKLPVGIGQLVEDARAETAAASEAQTRAAAKLRAVAAQLRESGLPNVDIAVVLGVSEQRVSQLFNGAKQRG